MTSPRGRLRKHRAWWVLPHAAAAFAVACATDETQELPALPGAEGGAGGSAGVSYGGSTRFSVAGSLSTSGSANAGGGGSASAGGGGSANAGGGGSANAGGGGSANAGGGGSGGSTGSACMQGLELCGTTCVDLTNDSDNCGECGTSCGIVQQCVAGDCVCGGGLSGCGEECVNLDSDSGHCGTCDNVCEMGASCWDGVCVTGPCDGLCMNPVIFAAQNYNTGNIQIAAKCYETMANLQGGNCGNFVAPRTLEINDQTVTCSGQNWPLPAKRSGGYCFVVSAGFHAWAYFQTF